MKTINNDAKQLLLDLSLYQVPVDPKIVCSRLGIHYQEVPYEGFDGLYVSLGDEQLIGVSSNIKDPGRRAFTCAHELGHSFYDSMNNAEPFKCNRDSVGYGKGKLDEIEVRANEFASELLMPRDFFMQSIRNKDPSWDLLKTLATTYKTSLQATANRFVRLTHHSCWLVIVKDGAIQRYTKADYNDFTPIIRKPIAPPIAPPKTFIETLASTWFYDSKTTRNKSLQFWPLPINQYGECPILLWDKGNTFQDDQSIYDIDSDHFDQSILPVEKKRR